MKLVFINPSLRPESNRRQLPVGLAYVMTAVKKAGFDFDLIDMDINKLSMEDLEEISTRNNYDIYALGCIVTGFKYIKKIANIIKKTNPKSVIIVGNSVATSIHEILLRNTKVDIAIMGEADITIVELLRALERKKEIADIHGLAFRKNGNIMSTPNRAAIQDIDVVGFPEWDIFELEKYKEYGHVNANVFSSDNVLFFPLNSARGCPFNCTFCYHVFKGESYRRYSDALIMDEIKRLFRSYNATFISFWDELTLVSKKRTADLVEKIGNLDFKIAWAGNARGNLFKEDDIGLIKAMRESGCDNISFSLENASPEILAAMNKKVNILQFVEQTKVLWKGGVTPLTSVIFGYPQETPETIKQTINVCEKSNIFPSVGFLLPLPGTPIYEWAKEKKHIKDEVEYLERIADRQDFHINLTSMSDDEFVGTVTKELEALANKQGLNLESVFKTTTYQRPKNIVP